jgi:hypothetical protein
LKKTNFFVGILSATDEKAGSGSAPTCHGSTTLLPSPLLLPRINSTTELIEIDAGAFKSLKNSVPDYVKVSLRTSEREAEQEGLPEDDL